VGGVRRADPVGGVLSLVRAELRDVPAGAGVLRAVRPGLLPAGDLLLALHPGPRGLCPCGARGRRCGPRGRPGVE
jgi:hypothetical protein